MAAARAERIARHPDMRLAAVAGRNPATRATLGRRHGVADYADWQALAAMDAIDAVFVTTHPDSHGQMSVFALEHGKHVFSESTLALTAAEAELVVETALSRRLVVRVGHTSPLRPVPRVVAEQVERLGGPVLDDVRIQFPDDLRRGRTEGFDRRVTGHPLLYGITLALPAVFGRGPVAGVRATAHGLGDGPVYESCVVTAEIAFESGTLTHIAYLRGFQWTGPGWRNVACHKGSVLLVDGAGHVEVATSLGHERVPIPHADPWATEIDEFVSEIRTGEAPTVSLQDAVNVVKLAEAAQASSQRGGAEVADLPAGIRIGP